MPPLASVSSTVDLDCLNRKIATLVDEWIIEESEKYNLFKRYYRRKVLEHFNII